MKNIFPLFFVLVLLVNCNQIPDRGVKKSSPNTEESKVPSFNLPKLLTTKEGQKINSKEDWEKIRRPQLLQLFEEEMFGEVPPNDIKVNTEERIRNTNALGGKATIKEVIFTFSNQDKVLKATLLLFSPNNSTSAVPIFLGYNFDGNHTIFPDESISLPNAWMRKNTTYGMTDDTASELSRGVKSFRWPVLNIINRGYGLATMYYGDIDPDFDDNFENGVHALFSKKPNKSEWGSLATWAWAFSKVVDYFETTNTIDHEKVIVMGHSRLGKTALWAGAVDERYAMVISNDSGCGGAALSKRKFGETINAINTRFPHWFNDNFNQYNDQEEKLPFDQHQLIALMAPRPVYIASAEGDSWADPKGEFLSGKYAAPAFQLYGLNGLEVTEQPAINQPENSGHIGYHVRSGKHDLTVYDWEQYLDFADMHLQKIKD